MLEVVGLWARHGLAVVLRDINLTLAEGEIGALLGPSGSGKTTLLRILAGFDLPSQGEVRFAGAAIARPQGAVAPEHRGFAMVFQDHALLPHLSVSGNIAFGLHRLKAAARSERIAEAMAMVGLQGLDARKPHELSGGQQQRVAVARALAMRPRLLLLDEPFSSLDETLRHQLQRDLRRWLKQTGTTALLVTHSQQEAYAVADRVGVIGSGRLHQWDTPYRVYHHPASRFVAEFVGDGVWLAAQVLADGALQTEIGVLPAAQTSVFAPGQHVELLLRPDDLIHDDLSPWRVRVVASTFRGADRLYRLALPSGTELLSLVPSHHPAHPVDEEIGIRLDLQHRICFSVG